VYLGQEKARGGDLDGGIRLIRKSLDDMWMRRPATSPTSFITVMHKGRQTGLAWSASSQLVAFVE
jgi:hypothetical protein